MNLNQLIEQATTNTGRLDLELYTNLVLMEAARAIKDTPITGAFTSFDEQVAKSQRTLCFKQVYNLITTNIENANNS
jgi:hypothetical protein